MTYPCTPCSASSRCSLRCVAASARADIILSTPTRAVACRRAAGAQISRSPNDSDCSRCASSLPSPLHVRLETRARRRAARARARAQRRDRSRAAAVRCSVALQRRRARKVREGVATLTPTGLATNPVALQIDAAPTQRSLRARPWKRTRRRRRDASDDCARRQAAAARGVGLRAGVFHRRRRWRPECEVPDQLSLSGCSTTRPRSRGGCPGSTICTCRSRRPRCGIWASCRSRSRIRAIGRGCSIANYDLGALLRRPACASASRAGVGHESNGKEGEDSRSFNMFYVRPTLTFGDPDGLRVVLRAADPQLHRRRARIRTSKDYRGYVDWLFGVGSKGGLDFWATLRKGDAQRLRQRRAQRCRIRCRS